MKDIHCFFGFTQGAFYKKVSRLALAVAMGGLLACSGSGSRSDAGTDSGIDLETDSGVDSGTDSGMPERRTFVTNTVHSADLGGIAGADEVCAAQAADAVLVDGTVVAADWDDLVDGALLALLIAQTTSCDLSRPIGRFCPVRDASL